MKSPQVSDTLQKVHTRVLSVTYEGPEVTLEMLRDFANRTRNQRMIPNWDPETAVSIEPSGDYEDGSMQPTSWVLSVTDQQHERSELHPRERRRRQSTDVPLPLEPVS